MWTPRAEKPVPITTVTPAVRGADPDDRYLSSRRGTTWPAAGRAEVQVPRPAAPKTKWKGLVTGQPAPDQTPRAKAGSLPIEVGPTVAANAAAAKAVAAPATPGKVEVQVLGRRDNGLRLQLRRSDGVKVAGKVSLRLDYSAFAGTFGGDWATRLQVVDPANGQTVATRNDGTGTLSADVPVSAQAKEFAVVAAAAGPAGDATSTPMNASATWQAGGSSGDFSWNYPMKTPPGVAGPTPEVALAYSSGSVDGRTTNANSQSSWVGAGFELSPGGSIERKYASCSGKSEQASGNENNAPKPLATSAGGPTTRPSRWVAAAVS